MAFRAWTLAIVASGLLLGCSRHSNDSISVPASPEPIASGPAAPGIGSSILASIDDARRAIALGDPIGADNDLSQALALGQGQAQAEPVNFPSGTGSADSGSDAAAALSSLLESFPVHVKLISAQTMLTAQNVAAADSVLMSIQGLVPARLIPSNLPLLEALNSLDRAKKAAQLGIPELRTQLLCAQAALQSYRGNTHVADAMALASTLGGVLMNSAQLRTLLPDQVGIWQASIAQWAGVHLTS